MRALVLSGGGLFGAWQAGAWGVLADRMSPDLIVGASIGSLNGYLIASGITPQELRDRWLDSSLARFTDLHSNIRRMMVALQAEYSVCGYRHQAATHEAQNLSRFRNHLAAPGRILRAALVLPQSAHRIALVFRWRPAWRAPSVGCCWLGATSLIGLQGIAASPSWWLRSAGAGLPRRGRAQSSGASGIRFTRSAWAAIGLGERHGPMEAKQHRTLAEQGADDARRCNRKTFSLLNWFEA
jgi:hypothetical protein